MNYFYDYDYHYQYKSWNYTIFEMFTNCNAKYTNSNNMKAYKD